MEHMTSMLARAALVGAFVAAAAPAGAETRLKEVLSAGVVRIGTTGDYKPFTYFNPQSQAFEGIDIDMAQSLGKALGVKVEFVKTSWPTLAADLTADKFDLAMGGISITTDRAEIGYFTVPVMQDGKAAIARCEDKVKFGSLAAIDQPSTRVVEPPGGTNEHFARANLKNALITIYPDNVTIFDQIVEKKADIMITDASETLMQQKLRPSLCALNPDHPFNLSEKAYWLQPDYAFKQFVDTWLRIALESGEYKSIMMKWLQ
jgi:cyclohexadienyl dehydratase